jgi:(2Fe-2S) ferredoxin
VILLARGGYGDLPQQELEAMLAVVRETERYAHVEGAFIDSGAPPFPAVLRRLAERGAARVIIAPVFVPADRHAREWLPKVVRRALKKHHLDSVEVVLAPPLAEQAGFGAAILGALSAAEDGVDVRTDAPRDVADQWLKPPPHTHHAFVCEGPRCATLGSHELFTRLRERLESHGLAASNAESREGVLAVRSSCLYPCNLGPIMVVYPEGTWYGALNERAIDQIVDEHFAAGHPVKAHVRPWKVNPPDSSASDHAVIRVHAASDPHGSGRR